MAILVDAATRVLIQGITGHTERNLANRMLDEGSPVIAGVSPSRRGGDVAGIPVFASCHEAVRATGADASFICVPAAFALNAALEAIDAGVTTIVVYAEGVPVHDALTLTAHGRARGARILGPNAAGCISPGLANLSDLNAKLLMPGPIGIVSKSGTLTYEVIDSLNKLGLGQSVVVCLGGDPVVGTSHADVLGMFEADSDTRAVVLIGEIGGRSELDAADIVGTMHKAGRSLYYRPPCAARQAHGPCRRPARVAGGECSRKARGPGTRRCPCRQRHSCHRRCRHACAG
jgi:succinyl-CoA synthetase alpha subunit